jgi:predicted nuclease of restriction endonuclease-like RecB superfamily
MLTSDLIKPRLRIQGSSLLVEMVNEQSPSLQQIAQDVIYLFHLHKGQSQAAWEEALRAYEGTNVDYILIRGLAKVLTDAATFTPLPTPLPPATLRERVFARGPVFAKPDMFHPTTRQEVLQELADELGLSAEDLDEMLFADRQTSYRLTDAGPAWTPSTLLARYNLELARAALYWASHITIEVSSNYKDLWKYIKLFKLMFWAEPKQEGGYRIDLDGPISPFVSSTLRYGRQLAAFLPALLLCERWHMYASVYPPQTQGEKIYQLDHTCLLQSHFKSSGAFDSRLEADFASEFAQKMGDKRGHWRLSRESEVLLLGDTVMVPDFVLVDEQDETRKILIELVGFWHPHYLRRKVEKVRAANCAHLLLLVYKGLNVTEEAFQDAASEVLFFQQKPVLKEVMETVEAMADRIYGPRQKPEPTVPKQKEPRQLPLNNHKRVKLFLTEHPTAKVCEVAEALAISRTTAKKWMQRVQDKNHQQESGALE